VVELRLGPPNFSGSQFRPRAAREIFAAKEFETGWTGTFSTILVQHK